jgi:hypothetical protein
VVDTGDWKDPWIVVEGAVLRDHWKDVLGRNPGGDMLFLRSDGQWLVTYFHHSDIHLVRPRASCRHVIDLASDAGLGK